MPGTTEGYCKEVGPGLDSPSSDGDRILAPAIMGETTCRRLSSDNSW
jgi:hypothetical protein